MGETSLFSILRSSFTIDILLCCSLLSITFAVERWIVFRKAPMGNIDAFLKKIMDLIRVGKIAEAKRLCLDIDTPASRLLHYGLDVLPAQVGQLDDLLATKRQEEKLLLERNLGVLGTMGNIAPFIGLFGTVVGIIKAFRDLALSGTGGPTVVARGIAEALVATATGLAVAIPAVILFNYFTRKIKILMTEMEVLSARFAIQVKSLPVFAPKPAAPAARGPAVTPP